ncbi:MAG: 50S ribosomal protein L25 [Deltaproteobacteria bacterium HGW-Deltaproteobacteria-14]|jgi:large subunit ribosomal protein L25|nr:MAG: 50S ribosomal protein L25 [Deltaproteobacteria bacterium HGW-Deltaproteobacteria-14]
MARSTVTVSPRSEAGKGNSHRLRADGKIPAVVYGKGLEPVAVTADPKQLAAILNGELGRNTPLDLQVEGEGASRLAVIKDYQVHPVKRRLTHVDFWQVNADQKLTMTVPFRRAGRSAAEKQGGKVRVTRDDMQVSCVADKAPAIVEFDMATLPVADANITVSMVPLPAGVEAVYKHDFSLIQVTMPRISAAEAAEAADAAAKLAAKGKVAKAKK